MKFIKKLLKICSIFILVTSIFFFKEASAITIEQEKEMGREFMKAVLKQVELIEDPLIVNYVNKVGQKIVAVLPDHPFPYHFYLIKEATYNAFAAPAGHVFINSGLLEAMENEEELAGILAHEIAHVTCRHISQKIEKASKINMLTLAGIAAGIFLGSTGSGKAANAITISSMAASQSIALAYSRENEMQADQIGLKYLTKAGYNGRGLLTMLKKIRSKQWFGSKQIPTYLTTHPASEERIVYIGAWLAANQKTVSPESGQTSLKESYDFEMAHTKLIAMYGEESTALRRFEALVRQYPANPIAHYGYGLILARTGNWKDSINHLKMALEKKAFDPYILKDLGRIYFLAGRYQEALNTLTGSVNVANQNPELYFFLGRAQMELGRFKDAASTFEKLLGQNPNYRDASYYLGTIYGKLGKLADAYYYLGIYYKNKGNLKNAVFQLKRALENTDDPDKKLKIKKMLKKIRKESSEKAGGEMFLK